MVSTTIMNIDENIDENHNGGFSGSAQADPDFLLITGFYAEQIFQELRITMIMEG